MITQNTRRQVKLIVFNSKSDAIREIEIVPDFEWGGDGCMGCDVGSGMVHWIPQEENNLSEIASTNIKTDTVNTTNTANTTSTLSPVSPVFPVAQPQSLLQAQYNNSQAQVQAQTHIHSTSDSPSKAPPVVSVNVPSSRPVIDNLSGTSNTPVNTDVPVITTAPPPPMTQFHHHPHGAQSNLNQFNLSNIDEDIPMPNFTVPSEIIHQK